MKKILEIEQIINKTIELLEEIEGLYLSVDIIKLKELLKKEKEWLRKWRQYDRIRKYEKMIAQDSCD
jgi:hypothetical protein